MTNVRECITTGVQTTEWRQFLYFRQLQRPFALVAQVDVRAEFELLKLTIRLEAGALAEWMVLLRRLLWQVF